MRKLILLIVIVSSVTFGGLFCTNTALAASPLPKIGTAATAYGTPDILVMPSHGPSASQRLINRTKSSWPWYIARAAGLIAAIALIALMLSGVGLITGSTFKFLEPLTAWATHRALGLVFAVSALVHITALLFDRYVPFTIAQVLVPFASHYRTATIFGHQYGSLYVAFGIFALYGALAIIISSLLWIDKKPHTWKLIHFLTYLVMIFVFFHALSLGTDLMHGVFRILWVIFGCMVAVAILFRLRRARSA